MLITPGHRRITVSLDTVTASFHVIPWRSEWPSYGKRSRCPTRRSSTKKPFSSSTGLDMQNG